MNDNDKLTDVVISLGCYDEILRQLMVGYQLIVKHGEKVLVSFLFWFLCGDSFGEEPWKFDMSYFNKS